ncbi:MAG TPA: hypothetical protein PKZ76_14930 [Xanthomonadaceae bacterium]|nr:hypothetical protein [Xanthomonadaceae bacterium]
MTNRPIPVLLATCLAMNVVTAADEAPWYVAGGHYGASYSQSTGLWQLLPLDGEDLKIRSAHQCAVQVPVPGGLWLVTSDANGQPMLLAPSTTPLPEGHPGTLALRACGDPGNGVEALRAPRALIDWLQHRTGAIHVED